jgi:hypothetical protein
LLYADDIIAQILKGKSDILSGNVDRELINYCFDRLITLRVESDVGGFVLREVGWNVLHVGHAVGNDAKPGSDDRQ